MAKYIFILGRNHELCKAEVFAVWPRLKKLSFEPPVLIVEGEISPRQAIERLGGTIKIAQASDQEFSAENIEQMILNNADKSKKIFFGFSWYGTEDKKIGLAIKKQLKEKGVSSRLVTSKEKQLSSVIVEKNKLLANGSEIIVVSTPSLSPPSKGGEPIGYWGRTIAVQDFKAFSERDYGRPKRDMLSGSMPPKLAKIMINLSQTALNANILDPFCGSGTMLQEAILMGYQNVVGSDISEKAIKDTENNLAWLKDKYKIKASLKLFNSPAEAISTFVNKNSVDAIISEPYLGKPKKGNESTDSLSKEMAELEQLYLNAFDEFKKVLKKGGRVVIIFPIFKHKNREVKMNIMPTLQGDGWVKQNKTPLVYSRVDQKVVREINVFTM
ncbi:MAG: hypothetical protein COT81_02535 [Candidatus Buchananbacteria bacterium CG10_big_fil_rev_8_21_14_0_10_42_9]|uniref:Ribosomal RNA large subunit methyltransferase K/L-like methyltransferase domain-containing protein n=1 Tax=Candidatus Buchananbacteria bacterium CG10_big_fil_rev_8_21_14_0_10_42_9 TaxID=1974526 RepID=A0A2H0W1F6_9BACT|nr:MAG: hypothetical protein COT81_02535 [Candidatus Buchananbacteria bacterium CG10_big_fil_rev_8_21_14_0_10_42_9]